ncbi:unnamed protein product [Mesocestoides corti]|uniref:Uncharacterized protein n=1 Tax=Mesocestoides corti TaxID=53468 RepID=A0A0R3UR02_MESCO|nr:unnamed protein product [Mesocestoides corti]
MVSLTEVKECAMRDRKRYQHTVDRINEAVRRRQVDGSGLASAMVAKPIRAGHAPPDDIQGGGVGGVVITHLYHLPHDM